jgi:hypothetical protein
MNAFPSSSPQPAKSACHRPIRAHSQSPHRKPSTAVAGRDSPQGFVIFAGRWLLADLSLAALLIVGWLPPSPAAAESLVLARNETVPTLCAEEDNVNVALLTPSNRIITSYSIEARHPAYPYDEDHGDPIWGNCPPGGGIDFPFDNPGRFSVYNDGITDVVAVREERWWRPTGMTVIGRDNTVYDAHYIAVHRMVEPGNYPQVLVFYQDGNLRLKPHPPEGRVDTLFGTSVVVGPAPVSDRPFVDVSSVEYLHDSDSFEITYSSGESARLRFDAVTRELSRVQVEVGYATPADVAFATFRSMYVADGIADADHMEWVDPTGAEYGHLILGFPGGLGSEFFLYRESWSIHNTSAPDIWVGDFQLSVVPEPQTLCLLTAGSLVMLIGSRCRRRRPLLGRYASHAARSQWMREDFQGEAVVRD